MSVTYKALLIGNSEFPNDPHGLPNLKGPVNDVKQLKNALCDPIKGLHEEENVTVLINEEKSKILRTMQNFFDSATKRDQLLFYYSGHGFVEGLNELYLCAKDTSKKDILVSGIQNHYLNTMLYQTASQKRVIILDCCNSGNYKGGDLPSLLKGEGRYVLTSTRIKELAKDAEDENSPSPFTKYLIQSLLDDAIDSNQDGYVSISEIYDYICPRLHEETKQYPNKKFYDSFGDLPLCKREGVVNIDKPEKEDVKPSRQKPKLELSERNIEHIAVGFNETISEDIIYVYNGGDGDLEWKVETEFDWIKIEKQKTLFKISYKNLKVGKNRGSLRVYDSNDGGSKTIRILVEKLPEEKAAPAPVKKVEPAKQEVKNVESKFLASFDNVKMRHPNMAASVVDNSEQSGNIYVYSDKIEFRGKVNITITNIHALEYYPQNMNANFTFNYMAISGDYDGTKKMMYFYNFSWFGAGQTQSMTEQIFQHINNSKNLRLPEFTSYLSREVNTQNNALTMRLPGSWNILMYQFGQQVSNLNLSFNPNGTMSGTQQSADGLSQINGTWTFNEVSNILFYNVMVTLLTGVLPEQGTVSFSIDQNGRLVGVDNLGRQWIMKKTSN